MESFASCEKKNMKWLGMRIGRKIFSFFLSSYAAVPDQSEQSMYDRSSIKSKCIDLHPVCGFWQPSFGLWNASDISYGIQTSQLGLQVVACNTSHLTDFAVYLAPTERVPGCGDSWISDQYLLFVIFSTIYSACFLYVSHRCYEIFRLSSWRSYKMNPTSEWTHSLSLVLVIVRLLFMYLGVMDAVDSAPDSFVIFILSLPHLLTFTIFSLMVFVWLDALLSRSANSGYLSETRKYLVVCVSLVLASTIGTWVAVELVDVSNRHDAAAVGTSVAVSLGFAFGLLYIVIGARVYRIMQLVHAGRTEQMTKIIKFVGIGATFFFATSAVGIVSGFFPSLFYANFQLLYGIHLGAEVLCMISVLRTVRKAPRSKSNNYARHSDPSTIGSAAELL
eukprot:TRINITY_DN5735_c0_g2_i15.p1 TRINITY_DN5735_c0_g2~~TRINITY_DN5735_c0_g2_i15.p1  ORF type:complete len:391 (+),score=69.49 TRINITY_DN5735_c0_g2_i15:1360-2532(+)